MVAEEDLKTETVMVISQSFTDSFCCWFSCLCMGCDADETVSGIRRGWQTN